MPNYLTVSEQEQTSIRTVKKSNSLVRSYYDLSLTSQRIIMIAISYIEDPECRIVDIPIASYKKYLKLDSFNYEHFDKVLKVLRDNSITIVATDKNTGEVSEGSSITGWVDSIKVKAGFISVNFNNDIWEHLINLKKEYTKYQLSYVLQLNSKHSIRLFEILKSYEYLGNYSIKTADLRRLLFLGDKYPKYNDFDKKILEPAINEINSLDENTDMNITYIPVKVGIRYDSIKFTITKNNNNQEIDGIEYPPEVLMAKSMSELELFMSIKTLIMVKHKVMFNSMDIEWGNCSLYTKYSLESTYLGLLSDDWKDTKITSHKAFFAEHLKRLSAK